MEEFVCADDYWPLLPNGTYEAQCFRYESKHFGVNTLKLFLRFKIIQGEYQGKEIFMAFNMPPNGKIKTGSKYYQTWVDVNGWQKPSRNTKMSPRIFKNKIFKVETRTVKRKHNDKKMPDSFNYSIVDKILEVVAG